MITIYEADAITFSGLGLGVLTPSECSIEEVAGGLFELTLEHPMDEGLRWTMIDVGRVIRVPAPVRETPLVELGNAGQAVTREIYKVTTDGRRLNLRTQPSTETGKVIHAYSPGTRVAKIGTSGNWAQVIVQEGGATGWMYSANLTYVGTVTETIAGDKPGGVVQPRQTREQLFRIDSIELDGV